MAEQGTKSLLSDRQSYTNDFHQEPHLDAGQFIKSIIYGGLDGSINTLALIVGGVGSGVSITSIMILGFAVIIGDGIGMGLGDYLSTKAQKEFILAEQKRQQWEYHNRYEDERNQFHQIYGNKGYSVDQINRLIDLFSTSKKAFVNIMMLEQLGLVADDSNPLMNGFSTFISFAFFGLLPLFPYIVAHFIGSKDVWLFLWMSIAILCIQLFSLGFAKAYIVGLNRWKSSFETLLLGLFAMGAGFGVSILFQEEIGFQQKLIMMK